MDAFMKEFQHLKIQLEEIQSATDYFHERNIIGRGGFGNVYKGVIPRKDQNVVAIKRLSSIHGQGNIEFWREITMLSRYTHENLISLVGYCDEGGEKIIVYEHAYNGSLDRHLSSPFLTWIQRIKICLEAARGLSYLHNDHGTHQRVLHRDVKSSNILLDENWKAKVSDMGLSKTGPANQLHTAIVTHVVGTLGYLDPLYMETGILSKVSDVYSFGVVLLEVLCGKLCYEKHDNNGQCKILVRSWKQSYKQNKLADIIFQDLKQQIELECLETFSEIAFQCLQKSRDKRPTMSVVVEKLESALDIQEDALEIWKEGFEYYEELARTAVPPLKYRFKRELRRLLSNGVIINGGKTWFSLDNEGKHCEMIFIEEGSLIKSPLISDTSSFVQYNYKSSGIIRTHVRAQFLSPLITYTVNLVFKADFITKDIIDVSLNLNYRLVGETKYLIPKLAVRREDGRMMVELFQFTSDERTIDAEIEFALRPPSSSEIVLEGIEFRPLEKAEQEVVLEHGKVDEFCKGRLSYDGQEWIFLNKNGKKCCMISAARTIRDTAIFHWESRLNADVMIPPRLMCQIVPHQHSAEFLHDLFNFWRFGEAAVISFRSFEIMSEIRSQVLSPETTYGIYLVYQLPENHSDFDFNAPLRVTHLPSYPYVNYWYIFLLNPLIPVIRPNIDENIRNPLDSSSKGVPRERSDGWMEVQMWEFETSTIIKMVRINLKVMPKVYWKYLVVQGIEIRPI